MLDTPRPARSALALIGGLLQATHLYPNILVGLVTLGFILLASGGLPDPWLAGRVWLVVMCGHAAIGLTNDYHDRERDRLTQPDKPIASGQLSARLVLYVIIVLLTLQAVLALTLPFGALLLALVATVSGLLYDFRLKDSYLSWVPYFLSFSTLPLVVWAGLGRFTPRLIWLYPPALLLTIGINLANALPDIETDLIQHASQGLAHRLGPRRALVGCWLLFSLTALLCLSLTLVLPVAREWAWLGGGAGLLVILISIGWYRLRPNREMVWKLCCISGFFTALSWLAALTL